MLKRVNFLSTIILGVACAFLMVVVGIFAINGKTNLPVELSLGVEQGMQVQVDIVRTNINNQSTTPATVFNNSDYGRGVDSNAIMDLYGDEVPLNSYYDSFRNLTNQDTLSFTIYSFITAPDSFTNPVLKVSIDEVTDENNTHISSSADTNPYTAYIKCYDNVSPYSGTVKLSNINPLQKNAKIYIKFNMELVEYNYVVLETNDYKIKEYTEAEYAKNSYGIKYSLHTAEEIAADIDGTPPTTNDYAEVKGMMGYYYYLEMGEYPMDYVGDTLNSLLTRTDTNDQGYTPTDDLHSSGTGEMLANQIIRDPTTNEVLYNLTLYKTYNQVLNTKYLNDAGTAVEGYKVCPIYWFEDILTREIGSNGKPIYGTGDKYVRSQVYGYVNSNRYASKYYSTLSGNNVAVDGTLVNEPTFTQNNYDWFRVEPCKWLIYSLENGDANTIPSGSENSVQLKTITNAISQNRQLKTKSEQNYDVCRFCVSENNWATSHLRATLNGITGTTIKTVGANSATAPYTFNENATLTDYVAKNMSSTYNRNDNILSPFIDNVFTKSSQNNIALTTNTTYFSGDTSNLNGISTRANYYSLTQEKLYPISAALTGETNAYSEFNSAETASTRVNLRAKGTDYAFSHYAINALYMNESCILSIGHNKLRSGYENNINYTYMIDYYGGYSGESAAGNSIGTFAPAFHFKA